MDCRCAVNVAATPCQRAEVLVIIVVSGGGHLSGPQDVLHLEPLLLLVLVLVMLPLLPQPFQCVEVVIMVSGDRLSKLAHALSLFHLPENDSQHKYQDPRSASWEYLSCLKSKRILLLLEYTVTCGTLKTLPINFQPSSLIDMEQVASISRECIMAA